MKKSNFSPAKKRLTLCSAIFLLIASSLACDMPRSFLKILESDTFRVAREEERLEATYEAEILDDEDYVATVESESVLEEGDSYGSAEENAGSSGQVVDPISTECGETGICVAVYPVDIRGTGNPPDVLAFANAGEYSPPAGISISYTENAGPWYEWLVLREPGDWVEASSPAGYSALGIQFWGDQTNGWGSVILDGVEVWRGDITAYGTDGVNYFVYVEVTGQVSGPHTLRTEVLGLPGKAGGDNVPVFYFAYRE